MAKNRAVLFKFGHGTLINDANSFIYLIIKYSKYGLF